MVKRSSWPDLVLVAELRAEGPAILRNRVLNVLYAARRGIVLVEDVVDRDGEIEVRRQVEGVNRGVERADVVGVRALERPAIARVKHLEAREDFVPKKRHAHLRLDHVGG